MSPTKRSCEELFAAAAPSSASNSNSHDDNDDALSLPPKRLRGGGGFGGDDGPEEELFDEEFMGMAAAAEEDPADFIPEEMDTTDGNAAAPEINDDIITSSKAKWVRPPVDPSLLTNNQDLNVQWLDIDMVGGDPLKQNPNRNKKNVAGNAKGQVPIIRLYGVNEGGHSVTVFIHGFTPYAYFALPKEFDADTLQKASVQSKIREILDARLRSSARGVSLPEYVLGVQYIGDHSSIMGYDNPHRQFLKVYCSMPNLVPTLKRIMDEGIDLNIPGHSGNQLYPPFECNVPFVLRYMIDRDITGAGWLTLPKETYQVRQDQQKLTHSQVSKKLVFGGHFRLLL